MSAPRSGASLVTTQDARSNRTGTWRYVRPVFGEKPAPCREFCPAGNPIAELMHRTVQGDVEAALRLLKQRNPIPGVLGRVCPHFCETACNRSGFDEAVGIHHVERFLGDAERELGLCLPTPRTPTGKRVAVVGSGPAGLGLSYHLALLGHGVSLFEAAPLPGGLLRYGIPAYRLSREALDRELAFIPALGIALSTSARIDAEAMRRLLGDFDAVGLATGAQKSHRLGIEGESLEGVVGGLDFLRQLHLGAPIAPGRRTIVVGGGNTAIDAARAARRLGAEVLVLYRRSRDDMPAFAEEIAQATEEGIGIRVYAAPVSLIGSGGRLAAVRCIEMRPGEMDSSNRARPVPVKGSEFELQADMLISAVGESPDLGFCDPAHARLFVLGDAGPNPRTVAHALGSGLRAARAIDALLAGKGSPEADARKEAIGPEALNTAYFSISGAIRVEPLPMERRIRGFEEIYPTPGPEAIRAEAGRCFSCGFCNRCDNCFVFCPDISIVKTETGRLPDFDPDYCKGCGICATECPRGIIGLEEETR